MTRLHFSPELKSRDLRQLDIPLEVRSDDLKIVGRTTSSQGLDVEPGRYFVSALLPAGQELTGLIDVHGELEATVQLAPDPGDVPPDERVERTHYLSRDVDLSAAPSALESLGPEPTASTGSITMRWIRGNVLAGAPAAWSAEAFMPVEAQQIQVASGQEPTYLQLVRADGTMITLATPSLAWQQSTVVVGAGPSGGWRVDIHLANLAADLLLHYRASGYAKEAAAMLESPYLNAESLLRGKMNDPVAAAVGAYALLRFADLDRLHDWTGNLFRFFPWLPDAAAIYAEHLARLGKHAEAVRAFNQLLDRGLPMFSDGVSYALDRLRLYREVFPRAPVWRLRGRRTAAVEREKASTLFDRLAQLSPAVDFGSPVLMIDGDLVELLQ